MQRVSEQLNKKVGIMTSDFYTTHFVCASGLFISLDPYFTDSSFLETNIGLPLEKISKIVYHNEEVCFCVSFVVK